MKRSGVGLSKLPTRRPSNQPTPSQQTGNRRSRSMSKGGATRASSNLGTRSSSNLRTPLSARSFSGNRTAEKPKDAMTPKRFQSTSKKSMYGLESARRISTMGPARGWRETRPLSDKTWQRKQIKIILDFLREKRFKNEALTTKHFPLSSKDFREVFNFLYSFLNPDTPDILPATKYEEKILGILKNELNYPAQITRTHMITMGSLHSWPTILGCIHYLFEMVRRRQIYVDNVIPIAFPSCDSKGFPIDRESKNKIVLEHNIRAYEMFMQGEENFDSMHEEFKSKMMEYYEVDLNMLKRLQEQKKKENAEAEVLGELRAQADSVNKLATQKEEIVNDLEVRLKKARNLTMKYDEMAISIRQKKEENALMLEEMAQNTSFNLPSTEKATEKMAEDLQILRDRLKEQRDIAKKKKAEAEAQSYHRVHEVETLVKEINRYCSRQEWEILLPMPEVGKGGVLTANPNLSHALDKFQHHVESSQNTIKELDLKIQERKENLERLVTKRDSLELGLNKMKEKDKELKDQYLREENQLDSQISQLKEQLILLSTKNQKAVETLEREIEEMRGEYESKLKFNEKRKILIDGTLEKMITKLKQTITDVLKLRDDAQKAVERKNEEYLKMREQVLLELDQIEEEVQTYK